MQAPSTECIITYAVERLNVADGWETWETVVLLSDSIDAVEQARRHVKVYAADMDNGDESLYRVIKHVRFEASDQVWPHAR